ncbi:MAG TPA: glycogen debranching N-terminal domain-containing protein, partial [Candidatus Gastranaerophilales bacterium]|nr:glycogen debranching N-terminal domain-containing protein [Candidatus Gastranaerophilales bacterium]
MSVILYGDKYNPIRRTIKHNNIFLVTNEEGNILGGSLSGYGLYLGDTRFLSKFEIRINDSYPLLLSSSTETGDSSIIIGTNLKIADHFNPEEFIPQETIQIKREGIICGAYFKTITIANYNLFKVGIKLELFFDADFLDIFEVRNLETLSAPHEKTVLIESNSLNFQYADITGAFQSTNIIFTSENPQKIEENKVTYEFILPPASKKELKCKINLKSTALLHETTAFNFKEALEKNTEESKKWSDKITKFYTDNNDFREMLYRSQKDLNMLQTKTVYGEYISAGIPWFTALFGRDSIIAAKQALLLCPDIAKNVLEALAKFQGTKQDAWREEEPGKILHEIRFGELARSNKIPHSPYYGSIDSTPLWIILLYEYFKWTNDMETVDKLWVNALECLNWMDNYPLYNGFASYKKKSEKGLDNQAWKDSWDSYKHINGDLAEPPISPVEVQGYFYSAKMKMASLANYRGETKLASELYSKTGDFKRNFHRAFWMEHEQYYALGLDKNGNQLQVISSNPGHLLETGILETEYASKVADRILQNDMFNGWGIRTLSYDSRVYNPMSYHNGSIWPHDNSIIAYGLSKTGNSDLVIKIT